MRLFKFRAKVDGLRGRYLCRDGQSQWLTKSEADQAIACGTTIAVRCTGDAAPYFAIMEYDPAGRNTVGAENHCPGKWSPPRGYKIIPSNEYLQKYPAKGKPVAKPKTAPAIAQGELLSGDETSKAEGAK